MNRRTVYESPIVATSPGVVVVPASQTDVPLCRPFPTDKGVSGLVRVLVSAATVGSGVTLKLQGLVGTKSDGTAVWEDSKTLAVVAPVAVETWLTIRLLDTVAGDQPFLPLAGTMRVVATTAAGGATISVTKVLSIM